MDGEIVVFKASTPRVAGVIGIAPWRWRIYRKGRIVAIGDGAWRTRKGAIARVRLIFPDQPIKVQEGSHVEIVEPPRK